MTKLTFLKRFFRATTSYITIARAAIMTPHDRERQELHQLLARKIGMEQSGIIIE